jgi:hypothetical protein
VKGLYDCIVSCLGSSAASKILKGVPKGGGAKLLKKLHAAKGSAKNMYFWSDEKYVLLVRRKICTKLVDVCKETWAVIQDESSDVNTVGRFEVSKKKLGYMVLLPIDASSRPTEGRRKPLAGCTLAWARSDR